MAVDFSGCRSRGSEEVQGLGSVFGRGCLPNDFSVMGHLEGCSTRGNHRDGCGTRFGKVWRGQTPRGGGTRSIWWTKFSFPGIGSSNFDFGFLASFQVVEHGKGVEHDLWGWSKGSWLVGWSWESARCTVCMSYFKEQER